MTRVYQCMALTAGYAVHSSLSETLHMVVAVPFLWGVPPEHENLRWAFSNLCWLKLAPPSA